MCSRGASSIGFALVGEVHYQGPGSFIDFRAWLPHRSMLVKPPPEQLTMWKFAGFFGSKGSADIGPTQGRGLDVGSPASRETAGCSAAPTSQRRM